MRKIKWIWESCIFEAHLYLVNTSSRKVTFLHSMFKTRFFTFLLTFITFMLNVAAYRWRVLEVVQELTSWSSLGHCVSSSWAHTGDQYWAVHQPSRDYWRRQVRTPGQVSNYTRTHNWPVSKIYQTKCNMKKFTWLNNMWLKGTWLLQATLNFIHPINQSINQSFNQSIYLSISQTVSQ